MADFDNINMNTLTLCSALNNSYLGIIYENKIYLETIKSTDSAYHSLYIISKLKDIIEKNGIDLAKFDYFSVNSGPGSFTGVRIALCIIKILANQLKKPVVPLNTSEILLEHYNNSFKENKKILIMDARKDMYFVSSDIDETKIGDIELIKKENIEKVLENFKNTLCEGAQNIGSIKIIADKRSFDELLKTKTKTEMKENHQDIICFEDEDFCLAFDMLKIAHKKYMKSCDIEKDFNYLKLKANYIQTPPVF